MIDVKHYNPLLILFNLRKLVKNSIFIFIYLFVIKMGSESTFIQYGRLIFLLCIGVTIVSIIIKWLTHTYQLDETSFHLYKGLFKKTKQTIPFSKIQNVNRHTSILHRIFNVTSLSFETGTAGKDGTVEFEVISRTEADKMEEYISRKSIDELAQPETKNEENELTLSNRTLHFKPTKVDLLKASFTSLSFFVLIPLIISTYFSVDDMFDVEGKVVGLFSAIFNSWWVVMIMMIVLIVASISFGMLRTFLKYGKYEIYSDDDRIYISKGIIDETAFSISKEKVQAIEINQSIMKRLFGLAEVKLTSAGSIKSGGEGLEINSLYPFLPISRVEDLLLDILPTYKVTQKMVKLPYKALFIRMLKPSWVWIIATIALGYFKPDFLGNEQSWWILSLVLFVIIYVSRWLDFTNTSYILNNNFIQLKSGSLTTSLFVSKREKIIEVQVTCNKFQKLLGLASIEITNRAKPVRKTGISDIPLEFADLFYRWYIDRKQDIEVE
ncbi:PH domain-containing protein [Bacillus spongiae]|uniref:PH domain-containing protein n=1 Tax=Bacillus spongiae TaxID=2683610 RepID=A0ABU8HHJ5_9BACI